VEDLRCPGDPQDLCPIDRPPTVSWHEADRTQPITTVSERPTGLRRWSRGRRAAVTAGLLAILLAAAGIAYAFTQHLGGASNVAQQGDPTVLTQPAGPGASATGPQPSPSDSSASPSPSTSPKAKATTTPPTAATIPDRPNCAPNPSACGLPDATNTGVPPGTKLTVVGGDLTVKKAGTVVANKDIRGCVSVEAPNVTIRDSKISCPSFYVISSFEQTYSGGGLLIENVEVDCQNTSGTGVGSYGYTAREMNIHGCENGFDVDYGVVIEDNYIHDLFESAASHTDGIQLAGGAHITIAHNTIFDPGGTSAIISNPSLNSDVLVQANLLAGGAYTLYCPRDTSTNYRVIGNRFSTIFGPRSGEYGPLSDCQKVAVYRDNLWDGTLKPVAPE
jgi:hypothetical protein